MSDKKLTEPVGNSNRLTEEEIIKNLKFCKDCSANINIDIIDLIDRQKLEIERLKSANDEKFRQWDMLAEKTKQHYADLYEEAKDILKAEAYKEFAERMKHSFFDNGYESPDVDFDYFVDNLVKEIIGE